MKKPFVVALAAALVLAGLGACGQDGSPGKDDTASAKASASGSSSSLDSITWKDGADGGAPSLTFNTPFTIAKPDYRIVKDGDGATVDYGQTALLDYVIYDASSGEAQMSTYDTKSPERYPLPAKDAAEAQGNLTVEAVAGKKVGTEIIFAMSQQDSSTGETIPLLFAMTISDVKDIPNRAKGTAIPQKNPALPSVTLDDDGKPSITVPKNTEPPKDLVSEVLIEGDGPEVKEGQNITIQYSGWVWADSTLFDSSWEKGTPNSFTLAQGSLIEGWVKGLPGKKVGSQVLLVIPPDQGYGAEGSGDKIPGGSTLVFVVDILDAF